MQITDTMANTAKSAPPENNNSPLHPTLLRSIKMPIKEKEGSKQTILLNKSSKVTRLIILDFIFEIFQNPLKGFLNL